MRNALLIMQYVAIALLALETGYVFIKWKTRIQGYLFLICLSTFVNSFGYLLACQSTELGAYLMGLKMSYLGRVWIPFSLLLFVNSLCKRRNNAIVVTVLVLVHTVVFGLVATCEYHNLYYANMSLDRSGLFSCLAKDNGIVHNMYNGLIIAYMIYGISILLSTTLKEKNPVQRKRLWLVMAAILADSLFFFVEILDLTVGFDDTVLGYAISSVFMYIAIFRFSLMDILRLVGDYVVDEISEGIVFINNKEEIEYFNKPAKEIFPQLTRDSTDIVEQIREAISGDAPLTVGEKIYTPMSREVIDEGDTIGTVLVLVDETQRYHYMEKLKEQKELAEAANASKSAFLSVVSHEIRTPMNAVVGMTDLLLREKESLNDKQEKYLKNIRNSGAALVMIVNDLLDQSKIEAGKMEIIEDSYELKPMTDDVKMIIENRIGSKPIHLLCEIDDHVPVILVGDSLRIRQILINLMNNAVKFTEEGFIKLSITCVKDEKDKKLLRFSVKDSGQGIKQEDLSKLGEAFSQVDTKRNHNKEGTGLGLSISRDFISMMGGQLEVTSEYGKGSEFFFSIYQGVSDKRDGTRQAWQQEDIDFIAPDARILVVDDTEINLMIMEECMNMLEVSVDTATSGEDALKLVKDNRYNLIFMDYMMPYMDGVATTEQIRALAYESGDVEAEDYYRSVPIVTLSGDSSDETKERFMRAGIDDFTDKPVDMKKLKAKLIKWLPAELIRYENK